MNSLNPKLGPTSVEDLHKSIATAIRTLNSIAPESIRALSIQIAIKDSDDSIKSWAVENGDPANLAELHLNALSTMAGDGARVGVFRTVPKEEGTTKSASS